jgi:hypothetical protein
MTAGRTFAAQDGPVTNILSKRRFSADRLGFAIRNYGSIIATVRQYQICRPISPNWSLKVFSGSAAV